MEYRLEFYEEPTKRIPKVGDRVKIILPKRNNYGNIVEVTQKTPNHDGKMSCTMGCWIWQDCRENEREFYDEPEEPKVTPKRVPKVGDYIKWL